MMMIGYTSHYSHRKIQGPSEDYVAILDLKTLEYRKLQLENLPASLLQNGIHVHGLDLFIHPETSDPAVNGSPLAASNSPRQATIYLINHRFPDHQNNGLDTADSVIEVFDTVIGNDRATHRRTIQHHLLVTPNNLVGLDHSSFYATNDHRTRKHWVRFPPLHGNRIFWMAVMLPLPIFLFLFRGLFFFFADGFLVFV